MCVCVCVCDLYKCTLVDTDELGRALRAPERRGTVQILIMLKSYSTSHALLFNKKVTKLLQ